MKYTFLPICFRGFRRVARIQANSPGMELVGKMDPLCMQLSRYPLDVTSVLLRLFHRQTFGATPRFDANILRITKKSIKNNYCRFFKKNKRTARVYSTI